MTVKVRFFTYFKELFGGKERSIDLPSGATVAILLETLSDTPPRRSELFAGADLKPHLVVMVNGESLATRGGLSAALRDGDVVAVFPLMGGG